jgi:hypothetical protein
VTATGTIVDDADPSSCSAVGGLLRSGAAALAARAAECPDSGGPEVERIITHLDRVGAALHVHAQELAELATAWHRARDDEARHRVRTAVGKARAALLRTVTATSGEFAEVHRSRR